MGDPVLVERDGGVATVTLNRPEAYNALNGEVFDHLIRAISELGEDPSIRAMILTGAGKAFCGGADVNDPYFDAPRDVRAERVQLGYDVVRAFRGAPFPTICAINGICVAIGVSIATICDVRIAAEDADFILGFARVGIFPDFGASYTLPGLLGSARALELVLRDDPIPAKRAFELGLVGELSPHTELIDRARTLARQLAQRSPLATRLTRSTLAELPTMSAEDALAAEAGMVLEHFESADLSEGIAAVRERREPQFTGR